MITGDHRYAAAAEHSLRLFYPELSERPAGSASLLGALREWLGLPAPLAKPPSERVNAWVCRGVNCLPPIEDHEALLHLFASR